MSLRPHAPLRIPALSLALACAAFAAPMLACWHQPGVGPPLRSEGSDRRLEQTVRQVLTAEPAITTDTMGVTSDQGVVTLDGRVRTLLAKGRSQTLAEAVRGVRSVINLIEVEPEIVRTDEALTQALRQALRANPATDAYQVRVLVQSGAVLMQGAVDSMAEAQLAQRVAEGVPGLRAIVNELEVRPGEQRSDRELQAEIQARLRWDALLDESLVRVRVQNETAFFSGTVGRASDRNHATALALVPGIAAVDVEGLEVEAWAIDETRRRRELPNNTLPQELEQAVELALFYDPRVRGGTIDAQVFDQQVVLRGTVDNLRAKRAAREDVEATTGVTLVRDELIVRPQTKATDPEVSRAVRAALGGYPFAQPDEIQVEVRDGSVLLSGSVASELERRAAARIAAEVASVTDVQTELRVREARAVRPRARKRATAP